MATFSTSIGTQNILLGQFNWAGQIDYTSSNDTVIIGRTQTNFGTINYVFQGINLNYDSYGAYSGTVTGFKWSINGNVVLSLSNASAAVSVLMNCYTFRDALIYILSSNDSITLQGCDDIFWCGSGNDTISGGAGNDSLYGDAGSDMFSYSSATEFGDRIYGFAKGQDSFQIKAAGAGGTLPTSLHFSTVSGAADSTAPCLYYSSALHALMYDADGTGGGAATALAYFDNSSVITAADVKILGAGVPGGTSGADTITGSSAADTIAGLSGNDIIAGGPGADSLDGGAGLDTAAYGAATSAVSVSLATGRATGGAGVDSLSGFENLVGSRYNDTLVGDAFANNITGGLGSDSLVGGAGIDRVNYATANAAVIVNLTSGRALGGGGADTLSGFENATGSTFNDTLIGSAHADLLSGRSGADSIVGGTGNDFLIGGAGSDTLRGGAGQDTYYYSEKPPSADTDVTDFLSSEDVFGFAAGKFGYATTAAAQQHVFTSLAAYRSGSGNAACWCYVAASHALYYDADGYIGAGASDLIASGINNASGQIFTAKDITIVTGDYS